MLTWSKGRGRVLRSVCQGPTGRRRTSRLRRKGDWNERDISSLEKIGQHDTLADPLRTCLYGRVKEGRRGPEHESEGCGAEEGVPAPQTNRPGGGHQPQAVSREPQRKV